MLRPNYAADIVVPSLVRNGAVIQSLSGVAISFEPRQYSQAVKGFRKGGMKITL